MRHVKLRARQATSTIYLSPADGNKSGRSLQKWAMAWADITGVTRPIGCWRKANDPACESTDAELRTVLVGAPVILRFEGDGSHDLSQWDAPLRLKPLGSRKVGSLTYTILGRIFWKANHFHSRYRWVGSKHIMAYNDLLHEGTATRLQGTAQNLLGGTQPDTHCVLYVLDGGMKTQQAFALERAREIHAQYNVKVGQLTDNPLIPLAFMQPSFQHVPHQTHMSSNMIEYSEVPSSAIIHQLALDALRDDSDVSSEPVSPRSLVPTTSKRNATPSVLQPLVKTRVSSHVQKPGPAIKGLEIPDDDYFFRCSCGLEGEGVDFEAQADVDRLSGTVQCPDCENWSHVKCAPNPNIVHLDTWVCAFCAVTAPDLPAVSEQQPIVQKSSDVVSVTRVPMTPAAAEAEALQRLESARSHPLCTSHSSFLITCPMYL